MNDFKNTLAAMSARILLPVDICWTVHSYLSHDDRWGLFSALFPQKNGIPDNRIPLTRNVCNRCWKKKSEKRCDTCNGYYCDACITENEEFIENRDIRSLTSSDNEARFMLICKLCETAFDQTLDHKKCMKRIKLEFY